MGSRKKLPWTLEKRELLYERKGVDYRYYGDLFFEAERYADALEFYLRGDVEEGIEKMKQFALENGDYYILAKIEEKYSGRIKSEEWRKAARRAEELEKFSMAIWLYEKCGEEKKMREMADKAGLILEEKDESKAEGEEEREQKGEKD